VLLTSSRSSRQQEFVKNGTKPINEKYFSAVRGVIMMEMSTAN
jgi:hypothetical protein